MTELRDLTQLDVEENLLTGNPFEAMSGPSNFRRLRLSLNEFIGEIPTSIGDFEKLRELWLAGNEFYGTLPTEIGLIENLGKFLNRFNCEFGTKQHSPYPRSTRIAHLFRQYDHWNTTQ